MDKTYRLPDGRHTTSSKKYFSGWRKLYRPIEKEFGYTCIGYDPNLLFSTGPGSIDISVSFATKLNGLIERANNKLG